MTRDARAAHRRHTHPATQTCHPTPLAARTMPHAAFIAPPKLHTYSLISPYPPLSIRSHTRADLKTWFTLDVISVLASLLDIGGSLDWFTNVNANLINALRLVRSSTASNETSSTPHPTYPERSCYVVTY